MNIKQQIEAGLRGEQSIPQSLIWRFARQQKIEVKPIIQQFDELVKNGSHTLMYIGQPADWTYVPRSAAYLGRSQDSEQLQNLKNSYK